MEMIRRACGKTGKGDGMACGERGARRGGTVAGGKSVVDLGIRREVGGPGDHGGT